jgi:hypothetical protein
MIDPVQKLADLYTALKKTTIQQVREVHKVFEVAEPELPTLPGLTPEVKQKLEVTACFLKALSKEFYELAGTGSIVALRTHLELEELGEVLEAVAENDLAKVLHEKADQRVVNDGTLLAYGLAPVFHLAFKRIIDSQWSKLDENGQPIKVNGRFGKGPNYKKPDVTDLVE